MKSVFSLVLLAALLFSCIGIAAPPLSRPAIQAAWKGRAAYRDHAGVLKKGQIDGEDVVQNVDGPCFLLSVLAGLAHAKPGFLDEALTERADGGATMRFYAKSRTTGRAHQVFEHVDPLVPRFKSGKPVSAQARDPEVLWPSLAEKLYAKHKGESYEMYREGGIVGEAMTLLTGKASEYYVVRDRSADATFDRIREAVDGGRVVVAGTYTTDAFRSAASRERLLDADLRGAMSALKDEERPSYVTAGLWSAHAYTVWGTKEVAGRRYVQLRDPMGKKQPVAGAPSTARNSGIFWLPLEQFYVLFEDMHIGG